MPSFFRSESVDFVATSFDPNEVENGFRLAREQLSWFLDGSATPFTDGHAVSRSFAGSTLGEHTILLVGSDGELSDSDSITVELLEDPADLPPRALILAPSEGQIFTVTDQDPSGRFFADVELVGEVSDPEGGALEVVWTASAAGDPAVELDRRTVVVGAGAPSPVTLTARLFAIASFGTEYLISLSVSDGTTTRTATVRVIVEILS